jgi:hypothetical protein
MTKIGIVNTATGQRVDPDGSYVGLAGDQAISGVKTFASYPLLPEAAPTADREAASKKYVDDNAGGGGVEVNTETLSADKTIADGDPTIQLLTPNGANRNVLLPATPAADCEFVIVNAGGMFVTNYLEIKVPGDTAYFTRLYPNTSVRVAFDVGVGWICYSSGCYITRSAVNTYNRGTGVGLGYSANGSDDGAAVGYAANGSVEGAAVGRGANGSSNGAAVGKQANGSSYGAAVGRSANGSSDGAAVGYEANGSTNGAAVGRSANGSNVGAATGHDANGSTNGAAVGFSANGSSLGAAVGRDAKCNSKQYGSAIAAYSQQNRYGGHARSGDHLTSSKQHTEDMQWTGQTTTATATEIFLHGVSANRCTVLASSVIMFNGSAVAKESATGDTKAWTFQGCIKRDAANNTVLVGAVTSTVIAEDAGASAWVLTIEADDTNESLKVTVTGEASHTIDWGVEARLLDRRN